MAKGSGEEIIFMLTKDKVLACADELGISKEQVTDNVVELVKSRIGLEFHHWPEIVRGLLTEVTKCPLGLVCYPSCFWWKDNRCMFPREDK